MKIGEYELRHQLNEGGMAQVWLAQRLWKDGKRKAAVIKMPRTSVMLDERQVKMFLDEARLAMQLDHDNIVPVFDAGIHEGLPWLAMSYVPGRNVGELVREVALGGTEVDFDVAAHVTRELGYALQYAHGLEINGVHQQIVHRDVAPKNVMISGSGGVLLTDFGVASAVSIDSTANHVKGTFRYMAPEHALGHATAKSDAFGMGTVLWTLLEGKDFRWDVDPKAMVRAAVEGHITPLTRRGVPRMLVDVVHGLLHPDESKRMNITEAVERLEALPSQRSVLKRMLTRYFGAEVRRSGHTAVHFRGSDELDKAMRLAQVTAPAAANPAEAPSSPVVRESEVVDTPATAEVSVPAAIRPDVEPSSGPAVAVTERLATTPADPGLPTAETAAPSRETSLPTDESVRSDSRLAATPDIVSDNAGPRHQSAPPITAVPATDERLLSAVVAPRRRRIGLIIALAALGLLLGSASAIGLILQSRNDVEDRPDAEPSGAAVAPAVGAHVVDPELAAVAQPIGFDVLEIPAPDQHTEPAPSETGTTNAPAEPSATASPVSGPSGGAPATSPPAATPPEPASPLAQPSKPSPRPKPPATPKVKVKVRFALSFVPRADIKVGSRVHTLGRGQDVHLQLPAGRRTVRWRLEPSDPWKKKTLALSAGHDHFVLVESKGPRMSSTKTKGNAG